ncbi:phosphatase PAP2 family protein [Halothiobacillus sp. DCM-1]|uniref:phosphatase PAP2 family protein n=1 Tax=Halothiobacillus sp. DCM-1 TaxID=3112558 RepID=UPI003255DA7B
MTASLALILLTVMPSWKLAVFHYFNELSVISPVFWSGMTSLADTYLALGLLVPVLLWRPRLAALLLLAALIATLITHTIKPILDVPRPPAVLPMDSFHLIGHRLDHGSFPSGHSVTAFTLAALLIVGWRLSLGWSALLLFLASVMAVSRLAVGVHWPTDILAGSVIGIVSVVLARRWLDHWPALDQAAWPLPTGVVITTVLALTAPWFNAGYPQGHWANWSVAILAVLSLAVAMVRRPAGLSRLRQILPVHDLGRRN